MDDRQNHFIKDTIIMGNVMPALLIQYQDVMIYYNGPLITSKNQGRHSVPSNDQ